ncbi:MAG: glycosyltransferase family 39 protein [Thermoanaerobaculia bacterium]
MTDSASSRSRLPAGLLLILILVWSLALSLWFASWRLNGGRFWDERFSVWNIRSVLETDSLRPDNGFYQSLSYLPQALLLAASEGLHEATGNDFFAVYGNSGDLSPNAYFLCRAVQALYGAGCLILTFLVGRRLFSTEVGLIGALILVGTPWLVHASAIFKPDILVALTTLTALLWSLKAAESPPSWRGYALAGFGIALASSAKLTGGVIAIPLVVATLMTWRDRRRLGGLVLAGAVSLLSFVALNPYFKMYFTFFERNLSVYAYRAESYEGTNLAILWRELRMIVAWNGHGAVFGILGLAAVALLAISIARPAREPGGRTPDGRTPDGRTPGGRTPGERLRRAMFLSFPLAYSLAYAAVTAHFQEQNFLPILPFTSLAAAWLLYGLWGRLKVRAPVLDRRWVRTAAALTLALIFIPRPFLYVYQSLVPTTQDVAMRMLRLRFAETLDGGAGRLVICEGWQQSRTKWEDALRFVTSRLAIDAVDRLDSLPASTVDRADGEIFLGALLDGTSDFYWNRIAGAGEERVERVEPKPFKARGEPVVAISHPWRPLGPATEIELPRVGDSLDLDLEPGTVVSLALRMPQDFRDVGPPELTVGDRPLRWYWTSTSEPVRLFTTERLVLEEGETILRTSDGASVDQEARFRLELLRWTGAPGSR